MCDIVHTDKNTKQSNQYDILLEKRGTFMDSILTLIALFVIIFIIVYLSQWLIPIILLFLFIFWIISLFTGRRHVYVHTFKNESNDDPRQQQSNSAPKHGAIDVEYVEHEDEENGDNQ